MAGGSGGADYCPACLYLLRNLVWAWGGPKVAECYQAYLQAPTEEAVMTAMAEAPVSVLQQARTRAADTMDLRFGARHPLTDQMIQATGQAVAHKPGGVV